MTESTSPEKKVKGTVYVRIEICKGCSYCIEFCPTKCLAFSREFNAKGYHYPVLDKPEDCVGCNLCGLYCPDYAIVGITQKNLEKLRAEARETKPDKK